jgi:hypothetical protein
MSPSGPSPDGLLSMMAKPDSVPVLGTQSDQCAEHCGHSSVEQGWSKTQNRPTISSSVKE